MIKNITFIIIAFFFSSKSIATENNKIDSLKTELKNIKIDSIKVTILNDLAWELRYDNHNQSIAYSKRAVDLCENKLFEKNKIIDSYNTMGLIYHIEADYYNSIKFYLKALKVIETLNNNSYHAKILDNIGISYKHQGDMESALHYFNQELKLYEEVYDTIGIAKAYVSLGNLLLNYETDIERKEGINFLEKAIILYEEKGKKKEVAIANLNLASSYSNFDKKLNAYKKALKVFFDLKDQKGIAIAYHNIGSTYLENDYPEKGIKYTKDCIQISEQIKFTDLFLSSHELLFKEYKSSNDSKNALIELELITSIKDSLLNEKKTQQIAELQTKYETEKKEQEINLLIQKDNVNQLKNEKYKQYLIFISGGIVMIIIISGLGFSFYRNKQKSALEIAQKDTVIEKQRTIQQKLKMLSAQMNPHFIFNSLNSIQYYITINDLGNSKLFLRKFSGLMRKTLENSEHTYISLSDEIATLKEYIDLERLRMEDQFQYTIEINDNIDLDNFNIPTLLIQPYVENAIWHGIAKKGTEGKIKITISDDNNRLKFVIDDNGMGRLRNQKTRKNGHKSYAMNITKTRLDLINSMEDDIINIEIIDKIDKGGNPTGTTVELYIPNDL